MPEIPIGTTVYYYGKYPVRIRAKVIGRRDNGNLIIDHGVVEKDRYAEIEAKRALVVPDESMEKIGEWNRTIDIGFRW